MTILWFVTGVSLAVALIALRSARRAIKQLEQASQNYWELKYQYGELRAQLQRLAGESITEPTVTTPVTGRDSFVPAFVAQTLR